MRVKLPELEKGVLLRRYKRFLADIETDTGVITVHCPNTGAMTGCAEPGSSAWYSTSDNLKRKYPNTLEIVDTDNGLVSVNTGRANALVGEALAAGAIDELGELGAIKAEARIPDGGGRFDFMAETVGGPVWIEVKSVTLLMGQGMGAFPDAVSARALKHVNALIDRVALGERGVLIFCVQHDGIERVRPAHEIDADYAAGLAKACASGVEVLAYGSSTNLIEMSLDRRLSFSLA